MWHIKNLIWTIIGFALLQRLVDRLAAVSLDEADTSSTADSPAELPKTNWKAALKETKKALKDKELGTVAAGLAYYATLTFFPALIGVAACFSYFAEPSTLLAVVDDLKTVLPGDIANLLHSQLEPLAHTRKAALGWAAIISFAVLLWTTSGGVQNLVKATNRAYDAAENRNFFKLRLASMGLSIGLLTFGAALLVTLVLKSSVLESWGWPHVLAEHFIIWRWVVVVVLISATLAFTYRYAPARPNPRWQWVSWGSTAAAIIWLAGTALFFTYAQHFANFGKTYGTFAGIIILMTWFNLSSFIILLGAQVNHNLEQQTKPDKVIDNT